MARYRAYFANLTPEHKAKLAAPLINMRITIDGAGRMGEVWVHDVTWVGLYFNPTRYNYGDDAVTIKMLPWSKIRGINVIPEAIEIMEWSEQHAK